MYTTRRVSAFALSAMALLLVGGQPAMAAVELLSHRAVYRLSLAGDAGSTGGITSVTGGLVMEWQDSCAGAVSNQRLGFVANYGDGPSFVYDVRFSSWESADSSRLRFFVRSYDDGRLFEEFRGRAALDDSGGGMATFTEPAGEKLALPDGTLFPTEHLRRLIEGARRGDVVVSHDVFDGSGLDGLSRITAVIGSARVADKAADAAGEQRWPVTLAYHDAEGVDDLPAFEIRFELGEGGVLHEMVLDYGEFALNAELEDLELFPEPRC